MKQFNGPKHQKGFGLVGALIGGALIGGAASAYGASKQAKAAKKAGEAQLDAARITTAENKRQYDLARQDAAPWMRAGGRALDVQQEMLFGPQDNPYGRFIGQQDAQPSYGGMSQGSFNMTNQGGYGANILGAANFPGGNFSYTAPQGPPAWFDEQQYLADNPDVQAEMDSGAWQGYDPVSGPNSTVFSPWDHYQQYGRSEGRQAGEPAESAAIEAYISEFVDPAMADQFRSLPPEEQAKYLEAGGVTEGQPNPNIPSQEYLGQEFQGPNYADFAGPGARGPLGQDPGLIENAQFADVVGPETLTAAAGAPNFMTGGKKFLPGEFQGSELDVTGPEFFALIVST